MAAAATARGCISFALAIAVERFNTVKQMSKIEELYDSGDVVAGENSAAQWPEPIATFLQHKDEANNCFRMQNYIGAVEQYQQALATFASNDEARATIHNNLAACWLRMNRHEDVVRATDAALALRPSIGQPKALYRRGLAYHRLGKLEHARNDFNRAAESQRAVMNAAAGASAIQREHRSALRKIEQTLAEIDVELVKIREERLAREKRDAEAVAAAKITTEDDSDKIEEARRLFENNVRQEARFFANVDDSFHECAFRATDYGTGVIGPKVVLWSCWTEQRCRDQMGFVGYTSCKITKTT